MLSMAEQKAVIEKFKCINNLQDTAPFEYIIEVVNGSAQMACSLRVGG